MNKLIISEHFESFQGEGPNTGVRSLFIRLGGCNLHCHWCDTAYTWRFSDTHPHDSGLVYDKKFLDMNAEDVFELVRESRAPNVVFTGGEPLLQQRALAPLINQIIVDDLASVEIETAGSIMPKELLDIIDTEYLTYNVSPKLASSGNTLAERFNPSILGQFAVLPSVFKFVVSDPAELDEVDEIVDKVGIAAAWVWIMPEGIKAETLTVRTQLLAPHVLARNYNLGTRLQIFAFGNKRGT